METKEDLIRAISKRLRSIIDKHLLMEEHPVRFDEDLLSSPKELHTIQAIGEREGINVTALASHFGVTKSAASQMAAK
jgi:DNA-binding MarR family transcriptional regulator